MTVQLKFVVHYAVKIHCVYGVTLYSITVVSAIFLKQNHEKLLAWLFVASDHMHIISSLKFLQSHNLHCETKILIMGAWYVTSFSVVAA